MASHKKGGSSAKSTTRNELTLKQRVELIEYQKKNPTCRSRKLAELFRCGRTQVQQILKKKESILEEFEQNAPAERKCHRGTHFDEVNEAVYAWYRLARQRNIPISGTMLKEEALAIAQELGCSTFKASNGWLESFKSRNNLKQLTVSGEAGDVCDETVEAWKERLQTLLLGYSAEDIWNEDETGCFYRALPDKTLAEKKKECKGGKKAKERVTVAFFVNAAGGKEFVPVVIGRAAKPRCFKYVKNPKRPAGLAYYSNKKAWMTTEVMNDVLMNINRKLKIHKRKVLLLVDNVSSHDPELRDKFSNIKVVFLPTNTTSKLQPLDAGIIKNFKVHYRRYLLQHTLSKIRGTDLTATEIVKTVDILTAIRWIKLAWDMVKSTTIMKCFKHCGVKEMTEVEGDPFADLDGSGDPFANLEMMGAESQVEDSPPNIDDLIAQFDPSVTTEGYLEADDDLSTCFTFNDTAQWREELRAIACEFPAAKRVAMETEDSEDEDEYEQEPVVSCISSLQDAISISNDLLCFVSQNGMEDSAEHLTSVIASLQATEVQKQTTQSSILQYFSSS